MADAEKVLYGFIAGEISEDFYGRTDIGKYDFGLKLCRNFFVDFCGGIKSRAGFEYCAPLNLSRAAVKTHPFRATADDYLLEFTGGRFRVLRYGKYVTQAARNVSYSAGGDELTSNAHGYVVGDLVFVTNLGSFTGRYLEVYAVTTNTFRVRAPGAASGSLALPAVVPGAQVARVYSLATPYLPEHVQQLKLEQSYERFVITHQSYAPRLLTYLSDANWTLAPVPFGAAVAKPHRLALTPSHSGTAGVAFAVTAVRDGEESLASTYAFSSATRDYSAERGSMRLNWNPIAGVQEYNVYRSHIIPNGGEISYAQAVGFVGKAFGPQFIDNNIVPDFTKAPPQNYNPFAPGAIQSIRLTFPGQDYTPASAITISDPTGSGFEGYPIIMPEGVTRGTIASFGGWEGMPSPPAPSDTQTRGLLGVTILNGGGGYTSPTVSVADGTGATFEVVLGPQTGTYPALCRLFQQRMIYAATANEPMRIWASKPGTLSNMDLSQVVNAGDGYSYQLDSQEVQPIRAVMALRYGMLIFTAKNITLLRAEEGRALSGVNAVAEPQAYKGINEAEPVAIDLDVIFAQRGSSSVNAMVYTEYTNSFQMQDLAVLSKHLIGAGKEIVQLAWQSEPNKLLWALRRDGVLLSLTYEREQEVFAWAQHETQGRFHQIQVLREGSEEVLYVVTERFLQGRWQILHERLAPRYVVRAENYFGADCAVQRPMLSEPKRIDVTTISDSVLRFRFEGGRPSWMAVGGVVFFWDGRFNVTSLVDANTVEVEQVRPAQNKVHVSNLPFYVRAGEWEYCLPTSTISGLWHLEGESVVVNADGDALGPFTVGGGQITLPQPTARYCCGLQYLCEAETLSPILSQQAIEGRLKDVAAAKVRLNKTRGLSVGRRGGSVYEMKDLVTDDWGDELGLRSDFTEVHVSTPWDELNSLYFLQPYPLPAHVLSVVAQMDLEEG